MCNEYARKANLKELANLFGALEKVEAVEWEGGLLPNDLDGKDSVRISDTAPIARLLDGRLVLSMTPWAWRGPGGKPVFNFKSEGRDFSHNDRVLIPATGFYEYTAPQAARVKLKDRHLFTMVGAPWFWIAGIVRDGAFAMLTTAPGPDVAPYHDRSIVTLAPAAGLDWLALSRPAAQVLRPPAAGTLAVTTLRRDGVELGASA